jgi:thiol:disulfide interchange protein DsbD
MKQLAKLLLVALVIMGALPASAAPKYVKWTAKFIPSDARAGEGGQIVLTASIQKPWHMYSLTQPDGGPIRTTIKLLSGAVVLSGAGVQPTPHKEQDPAFKITSETFEGTVSFGVPLTLKKEAKGSQTVKLQVRYQVCNASTCMPPEKEEISVTFKVTAGAARANRTKPVTKVPATQKAEAQPFLWEGNITLAGDPQTQSAPPASTPTTTNSTQDEIEKAKSQGILKFILISMGAGFLALLTPCVFPMIPITVSYFTKRKAGQRGGGVPGALAYSGGIVSTFTLLGIAVTSIFGAQKLSQLGTNPYVNLGFAVLFMVLALNLLGMYEIAVPAGLANKVHTASTQKGGYLQPYLMGLAFTMTSFTCTAPYVGTLLASATQGGYFYPTLGMLAFSTAFAAPFFLLAIFPQRLASMPKSGSWLVTVKAYMGFLEIAAAMKFLSNADLVWTARLINRPVFLASWMVIMVIAGLYMIGGLRLPHDNPEDKIGIGRKVVGVGTLAVAGYLFAAMLGANLGWFEAFPPPPDYAGRWEAKQAVVQKPGEQKEAVWLEDYEKAVQLAKEQNKPLFIDFTGVTCVNCRLMERDVFPKPEVQEEFKQYVLVRLWTDRDNPQDEKNKALQEKLTNSVALPTYVSIGTDGKTSITAGLQSVPKFSEFLKIGRGQQVTTLQ